MAIRIYEDYQCTTELNLSNKDEIIEAVEQNSDYIGERKLFLKSDDAMLTYRNITIEGYGDVDNTTTSGEVDVKYALDVGGSPDIYAQKLNIPNGNYNEVVPIWRKVIAPNVQSPFLETEVEHQLYSDAHIE
jgi:hypothetical protein